MEQKCKYSATCTVCCEQEEVDTIDCEYFKLKEEIENLQKRMENNERLKNIYYLCISRSSLILEEMCRIKWNNDPNTLICQAQELLEKHNKAEEMKDETGRINYEVERLSNENKRLQRIIGAFQAGLNHLISEEE